MNMRRDRLRSNTPSCEGIVIQPFAHPIKAKLAKKQTNPKHYKLQALNTSTPQDTTLLCATRITLNPQAEPFEPPKRMFATPILIRQPVVKARKDGDESTKSEKITAILDKIEKKYREREVYNKMYETSDGSQVIRIDVRSVRALEKIEEALKEVDCPPLVKIVSLSTRYSCKKNGKKKGFNLFLKFENDSQRTFARYILESYCYEEKLWVVKDIPPKVLRTNDQESVLDNAPVIEMGAEKPEDHVSRGD